MEKMYIIPTSEVVGEIHRMLLAVDNSTVNFELILDKTRLAINNYNDIESVITIIADSIRPSMSDATMHNSFMLYWTQLVVQIFYYIVSADIQLPIHRFAFQCNDMCIIAEG